MTRRTCTRCRQPRAAVRPYDVRAYDGDRHPAKAELCKPCAIAALRGRAKLSPRVAVVMMGGQR